MKLSEDDLEFFTGLCLKLKSHAIKKHNDSDTQDALNSMPIIVSNFVAFFITCFINVVIDGEDYCPGRLRELVECMSAHTFDMANDFYLYEQEVERVKH